MAAPRAKHSVKLMVAYRLHFERANLEAIEVARSGRIGEPRLFTSTFTMHGGARQHPRASATLGGGTLYDIGIYCINAARACSATSRSRSRAAAPGSVGDVEEIGRARCCASRASGCAAFTCSFGAAKVSEYRAGRHQGRPRASSRRTSTRGRCEHRLTLDGEGERAALRQARPVRARAPVLLRLRAAEPRSRARRARRAWPTCASSAPCTVGGERPAGRARALRAARAAEARAGDPPAADRQAAHRAHPGAFGRELKPR